MKIFINQDDNKSCPVLLSPSPWKKSTSILSLSVTINFWKATQSFLLLFSYSNSVWLCLISVDNQLIIRVIGRRLISVATRFSISRGEAVSALQLIWKTRFAFVSFGQFELFGCCSCALPLGSNKGGTFIGICFVLNVQEFQFVF